MDYTADGLVSEKDMCRLLGISSRRARELREEGNAWPRYRVTVSLPNRKRRNQLWDTRGSDRG
jgi:hypothetical protein